MINLIYLQPPMEILIKLLILILLIAVAMFFTAAETSLTVLRRTQIKKLIKEKNASGLTDWLTNPNRLLATTLIGTVMSVVGVAVIAATISMDLSREFAISPIATTTVSTVLVIIVVLIFVEISPKAYARRNAQKVSVKIIKPLKVISFFFTPLVKIFTAMANIVIKISGGKPLSQEPLFAISEIKGLIEMGVKEGVIARMEKDMLSQIMEFGDTVVREVMIPKIDMKSLDLCESSKILIEKAIHMRHSRIPVYREEADNIIGLLYVKDLLPLLARGEKIDIEKILRKPYFVPEAKQVGVLLKEFRQGREHIAVVVDEYGVPVGVITIEDIVEEITGEIFDEYDIRKNRIVKISDKVWEISAIEDLDKINDELKINLPEDTYDSLGGLVVGELGKLPVAGEEFYYKVGDEKEYKMKIVKATPRRVLTVRIHI